MNPNPIENSYQTCPGCGNSIDPEVCWCGDYIKDHSISSGHSPIPMGCDCGRPKEKYEFNIYTKNEAKLFSLE